MNKIINFLLLSIIIFFIFYIFKYYSSNVNIKTKNYNRLNIEEILNKKIDDLPVLLGDTKNIIEFNDAFDSEIKNEKKRSFWELLRNK